MPARKLITDEQLLDWTRRRADGENPKDIAPTTPDYCRAATNRVLADDIKCSDEDEDAVRAAYWPGKSGPAT